MSTATTATVLFLTPAEAAVRLRMKESTLRRRAQAGDIPHRRDGRFLRFTEQDLADYVARTAVRAANPMQLSR